MKIGIIDLCKQIEDPSMNRKKVHKMETSIYISIAAVICEVQSWNEIEEFGNSKIAFFKSRIPGLEFIPSHDTFNRFFSICLLYTSPSPRDRQKSRMPSSA